MTFQSQRSCANVYSLCLWWYVRGDHQVLILQLPRDSYGNPDLRLILNTEWTNELHQQNKNKTQTKRNGKTPNSTDPHL